MGKKVRGDKDRRRRNGDDGKSGERTAKTVSGVRGRESDTKKSDCHIHAKLEKRVRAVHILRKQHKIVVLCRVLGVNRSTYYKHYEKSESKRSQENRRIRVAILEIYARSKKRFGAHKINILLKSEYGIHISIGRVYRLMKGIELPKISTAKPVGKKVVQIDESMPKSVS